MANVKWAVDPAHSHIGFSVKHMMFTTVRGSFNQYEATILADPADMTLAEVDFSIDVTSIDTRSADRDNHLRSGDFFDVEQHPKMTFKSTGITRKSGDQYHVTGDLTIRGVTKPVTFDAEFDGEGKDPWGGHRAGFTAVASINRSEFDLKWNAALETGGVMVSDQVKIELHIEAVEQA